jgi:hypothetical protein
LHALDERLRVAFLEAAEPHDVADDAHRFDEMAVVEASALQRVRFNPARFIALTIRDVEARIQSEPRPTARAQIVQPEQRRIRQ